MTFIELDTLDAIESASGKNAKLELLKSQVDNERFFQLLNSALSFFKKYYIKKFDMPGPTNLEIDRHDDFLNVLSALESRKITGDAARMMVENFFRTCNRQQQKWYGRVLLKSLDSGFTESSAIKAGFPIPKFDVMLAKDGYKTKKAQSIVEKGVFVSRKLDGYRCIAIYDGSEVTLYSRNGSVYENFPQVQEELKDKLNAHFKQPVVLDGEIMSDDFQAMQKSAFASKRGTTVGDVQFHVFGCINYNEWMANEFKEDTERRIILLDALIKTAFHSSSIVKQVEQVFMNDYEALLKLEEQYVNEGYEGLMALPASSPYYRGRKSNQLMKFKAVVSDLEKLQTMDVTVIGCYEGEKKNTGRLGGLHVIQEDGKTKCKVGSGYKDVERQAIWDDQESVIGRICEVKYQELTKDGVMRFPIFLRWRDNGAGTGKR